MTHPQVGEPILYVRAIELQVWDYVACLVGGAIGLLSVCLESLRVRMRGVLTEGMAFAVTLAKVMVYPQSIIVHGGPAMAETPILSWSAT